MNYMTRVVYFQTNSTKHRQNHFSVRSHLPIGFLYYNCSQLPRYQLSIDANCLIVAQKDVE